MILMACTSGPTYRLKPVWIQNRTSLWVRTFFDTILPVSKIGKRYYISIYGYVYSSDQPNLRGLLQPIIPVLIKWRKSKCNGGITCLPNLSMNVGYIICKDGRSPPHTKMAPHFLVLTYPAQGHINPALHFARRLAGTGHWGVTFSSTIYAHRRMLQPPTPDDPLSYAPFSDGYDDGFDFEKEGPQYIADFNRAGPVAVSDLVRSFSHEGRPVTFVIYTLLLPWAADVARDLGIPCCHLWIQPAAVFVIYHHYFHGSDAIIGSLNKDPSSSIKLPGLPPLTHRELPSFIFPSDSYPFVLSSIKQLFQALDKEEKPHVLVNTFDALEEPALRVVHSVQMAGVGPLIPSAFLGSKSRIETSSDYIEWLESKHKSSVVYVSFGTLSALSKQQMEVSTFN